MATDRGVRAGRTAARIASDGMAGTIAVRVPGGVYVSTRTGDWLLVTGPRAPLGPLSLQLGRAVRSGWRPGDTARVQGGVLTIGSDHVDLSGLCVEPLPVVPDCAPNAAAAMRRARAALPSPPANLLPGLAALAAGDVADAVLGLAGRGGGLTPAGDDVLAGYCAWRLADAATDTALVLAIARSRAAPLGLAYLSCAVRGELVDVAARLMAAVRCADVGLVTRRARALGAWGASSGAAILWGMDAAFRRDRLEGADGEPGAWRRVEPATFGDDRSCGALGTPERPQPRGGVPSGSAVRT